MSGHHIPRLSVFRYMVLMMAAWALLAGCGDSEKPVRVDLDNTRVITLKKEQQGLTYAYLPQYSHRESFVRHNPLVRYLEKKIGLPVRQVFPDTFDQHMTMMGQGKIDISFSNPVVYVRMNRLYGTEAFARIVENDGRDSFRGQVICRADNASIGTLADCRGKTWIAVDMTSAGGYIYPLGLFMDHGIRKSDFREIVFAPGPGGKQEKVILSVHAGKYDVGTIREGALGVVAGLLDIDKIRVVAATPTYPGWVYAARKNLDKDRVDKIRSALTSLDFEQPGFRRILTAAHFIAVKQSDDSEFEPVRQLIDRMGEDAY